MVRREYKKKTSLYATYFNPTIKEQISIAMVGREIRVISFRRTL